MAIDDKLKEQIQKTGVDPNHWNDWLPLAGCVADYDKILRMDSRGHRWRSYIRNYMAHVENIPDEEVKAYELAIKEHWRETMTGLGGPTPEKPLDVVRTPSDRYRRFGLDLSTSTKEEFEAKLGMHGLRYEPIKRLDDLARECNSTAKDAAFLNKPIPWDQYKMSLDDAFQIIYGETRTK